MKINVSLSTDQFSVLLNGLSFAVSQHDFMSDFFADNYFSKRSKELCDLLSYILNNREVD